MPYEFPVDPQHLFDERQPQMVNSGIPAGDVASARAAIDAMWRSGEGGWAFEWSKLAQAYADAGQHYLASLAFGWAKFPTLANEAARQALGNQLEQYLLAAKSFPVEFERRVIDVPFQGGLSPVAVHIYAAKGLAADAPVILGSGGVDTWKMDMHGIWLGIAQSGLARVIAFDIPGTGESKVAMSREGGGEIVRGLVAAARAMRPRKIVHLGVSFGGYYAAMSGLSGLVDAAVDWGGPVDAAFAPGREAQFGMSDIVGNALGFDKSPTPAQRDPILRTFSLRDLLDRDANAPMLVINGADDVHVPQADTLVFKGRRATEVHLIPETGHCATTKMGEVVTILFAWLSGIVAK